MIHISPETQVVIAKPLASGAVAVAIDRFFTGTPNLAQNLAFGTAVASGVFLADLIAKNTPSASIVTKSIEGRILEVGLASGGALAIDKFVFHTYGSNYPEMRILTAAASEMGGEWLANSFLNLAY